MDTLWKEQVVKYLREISHHTEPKPSIYVQASGTSSVIKTDYTPALEFPPGCQYEIACCGVETYYSFPNITKENNKVKVSLDGTIWHVLAIPTGCYEIESINTTLQRMIVEKGGVAKNFCLSPNKNTFQSIIIIKNLHIDFRGVTGSLRTVLGFDAKLYEIEEKDKAARFESEHIVNILRINSILVHCDVVNFSRRNGRSAPIIYTFFPNVTPGSKIVDRPRNLIYLPLTLNVISHITCWLTDQDGAPLDFRGEKVTLTFHIKAC